jgi:hypothetical protein
MLFYTAFIALKSYKLLTITKVISKINSWVKLCTLTKQPGFLIKR